MSLVRGAASAALTARLLRAAAPDVVLNDDFEWPALRALIAAQYDCVVVSPGPGTPARPSDVGALPAEASVSRARVTRGESGGR